MKKKRIKIKRRDGITQRYWKNQGGLFGPAPEPKPEPLAQPPIESLYPPGSKVTVIEVPQKVPEPKAPKQESITSSIFRKKDEKDKKKS